MQQVRGPELMRGCVLEMRFGSHRKKTWLLFYATVCTDRRCSSQNDKLLFVSCWRKTLSESDGAGGRGTGKVIETIT